MECIRVFLLTLGEGRRDEVKISLTKQYWIRYLHCFRLVIGIGNIFDKSGLINCEGG